MPPAEGKAHETVADTDNERLALEPVDVAATRIEPSGFTPWTTRSAPTLAAENQISSPETVQARPRVEAKPLTRDRTFPFMSTVQTPP